jgi:hypothetical protein
MTGPSLNNSAPLCVSPEETAHDDEDEEQEADGGHGPEGDLQRRVGLPPELTKKNFNFIKGCNSFEYFCK